MKKVLIVTSVASMIEQFNIPNIKVLKEIGYDVTVATNFKNPGTIPLKKSKKLYDSLITNGVTPIEIPFSRTPVSHENIKAYKRLKVIIREGNFNLIHCQSPIGGALTRLAARGINKFKPQIFYTAHGFHFYDGAPKKNWIFYIIEKQLSKYTDVLITINNQDYQRALAFNTCLVEYIPGIGIDTDNFSKTPVKRNKRKELGIPNSIFLLLSVGELNKNKNHKVIIEAMNRLNNPEIHYAISGIGPEKDDLAKLVDEYNLNEQIHFLGYRNDIAEIYKIADVFAFPSKREGLGLAAIEALAAGLPLLTSNKHGINDYSIHGKTGFKYEPEDINGFMKGIIQLYTLKKSDRLKLGQNNREIAKQFDRKIVNQKMLKIYQKV